MNCCMWVMSDEGSSFLVSSGSEYYILSRRMGICTPKLSLLVSGLVGVEFVELLVYIVWN